ncbi:hypothetical protein PAPYR_5709 [Paratrimastix pyriformis]|uniref:Uncharacterized protein n=1 Tax=Paratrimastix pyriformis TaxID=342808 RepID=A0ABQ8UI84_9EUKA|nr:hypothetical protein PAPYR_5709 [Paratrimastix pyriformis]
MRNHHPSYDGMTILGGFSWRRSEHSYSFLNWDLRPGDAKLISCYLPRISTSDSPHSPTASEDTIFPWWVPVVAVALVLFLLSILLLLLRKLHLKFNKEAALMASGLVMHPNPVYRYLHDIRSSPSPPSKKLARSRTLRTLGSNPFREALDLTGLMALPPPPLVSPRASQASLNFDAVFNEQATEASASSSPATSSAAASEGLPTPTGAPEAPALTDALTMSDKQEAPLLKEHPQAPRCTTPAPAPATPRTPSGSSTGSEMVCSGSSTSVVTLVPYTAATSPGRILGELPLWTCGAPSRTSTPSNLSSSGSSLPPLTPPPSPSPPLTPPPAQPPPFLLSPYHHRALALEAVAEAESESTPRPYPGPRASELSDPDTQGGPPGGLVPVPIPSFEELHPARHRHGHQRYSRHPSRRHLPRY